MKSPFQKSITTIKRSIKVLTLVFLVIIFNSCYNQFEEEPIPVSKLSSFQNGMIVLGNQLENPYTVENMKVAYDNLQNSGAISSKFNIRTTHLYLKFQPQNEEEWDLLKSDSTWELFDYPLDFEIEESGLYYHDPEVPTGQPTYQYVAVEVDKKLPLVKYEVLEELYLPDEDPINGRVEENADILKLENEALRITNNLNENLQSNNISGRLAGSTWYPSGRVTIWDDVIGETTTTTRVFDHWEYYPCDNNVDPIIGDWEEDIQPETCQRAIYRYETSTSRGSKIPIVGVKVRARSWFKIKTDLTDAQGYYQMVSFNNEVNYDIKWERNDYDIREGDLFQAYFSGPKRRGSWNVDLVSGSALRHGIIHRAAHRYFYMDTDGLRQAKEFTTNEKVKIAYKDEDGTGVNWGETWAFLPTIKIYGKRNGVYRNSNDIFSTTIHEIAHTTHIGVIGGIIQFGQVNKIIRESWPNAVEWFLTRLEYEEYHNVQGYDNPGRAADPLGIWADHQQWWNNTDLHDYTPLFIDLVDDFDNPGGPNDQVTGYSMEFIETTILPHAYGLVTLSDVLLNNRPNGVTEAQLNNYLDYFFNL